MKSLTEVILKSSKRNQQLSTKATVREKILYLISFGIVFGFLAVSMIVFSISITKRLIRIGQSYTFINLLMLMNFMILFVKSIFESLNVLYFSKDLKLLLRLPIDPIHIVHAKILNMIKSEYQMEIIMLGIPMFVYGILMKNNIMFYLYVIAILLLIPIIPILITTLIISIIMRFTNIIKNKSKVMYITIILAMIIIGIVTGTMNSGFDFSINSIDRMILSSNGIAFAISEYFVLIKPIMYAMMNYDSLLGLKYIAIYLIESLVLYLAVIWIISKIYIKGAIGTVINSSKSAREEDKELTLEDFKPEKSKKAYFLKEFRLLNRTPIFSIQCIIVPIIYPISIFICLIGLLLLARILGSDKIGDLFRVAKTPIGAAIFISVGEIFNMMNFASIIGVSKESRNAILSKYIPMSLADQFELKIKVGRTINILNSMIVSVSYLCFTKNILLAIGMFSCMELANVVGEKFKLFIDLRNPKLNWESEYTMMKQNTNVMYVLFYTLLVDLVIIGFGKIINNMLIFMLIILGILYVINYSINRYINEKEYEIFRRLF